MDTVTWVRGRLVDTATGEILWGRKRPRPRLEYRECVGCGYADWRVPGTKFCDDLCRQLAWERARHAGIRPRELRPERAGGMGDSPSETLALAREWR